MDEHETNAATIPSTGPRAHHGGCHCGAARFRAELDLAKGANRCNCSVCHKTSVATAVVKPDAFALLSGEQNLGVYAWGAKISQRFFCTTCGVHVFARGHLAELGGDYVSVNINCVDDVEPADIAIHYWDGRHDNWDTGPRATPWPIGA